MKFKPNRRSRRSRDKSEDQQIDFETYFKIGVSDDFILIREDFPLRDISPGDFSKLVKEMFRRNDEVFNEE